MTISLLIYCRHQHMIDCRSSLTSMKRLMRMISKALLLLVLVLPSALYAQLAPPYDRSAFGSWADIDHDCQNTRHELLAELSTAIVALSANECRVTHGRWLDPYSGKVFFESKHLDIDHLVPLKFAWEHGASGWSDKQRRTFANDTRNLFAVEARLNQQKGAKGPLEWLPPNLKFQCQYVLRFTRIMTIYGLVLSTKEAVDMTAIRIRICK